MHQFILLYKNTFHLIYCLNVLRNVKHIMFYKKLIHKNVALVKSYSIICICGTSFLWITHYLAFWHCMSAFYNNRELKRDFSHRNFHFFQNLTITFLFFFFHLRENPFIPLTQIDYNQQSYCRSSNQEHANLIHKRGSRTYIRIEVIIFNIWLYRLVCSRGLQLKFVCKLTG